ncbi:MAG: class I SAM-dependent methyltransferase [Pseudobdellovibrionaceae bacterium]
MERSLTEQYNRQLAWRDWQTALSSCPISPGQKILDLGCGPGDQSLLLSERGVSVTGVDNNIELLTAAKVKCPNIDFLKQDLNKLTLTKGYYDGLWSSFTAAAGNDMKAKDVRTITKEVENVDGNPCMPEGKSYQVELQVKLAAFDHEKNKVIYSWETVKTIGVDKTGRVIEVCAE